MKATTWASDSVEGDPLFLDVNINFKLKKCSVAIGTGTLKNAFPIDFEGNRRFEDFDTATEKIDLGFQKFMYGKY